jgi:aminoglycoside phosphotransferase family enzyme
MHSSEIRILKSSFPDGVEMQETHISWVILSGNDVYKIKKPVRFSFLDFSTLDLRQSYCHREIELNRRLAKDIYIDVVPIYKKGGKFTMHTDGGEIVDYAVHMRRIPGDRRMDLLLQENRVTRNHIELIAARLASFHAAATVAASPPDIGSMREDFSDISTYSDQIASRFGETGMECIRDAIRHISGFLEQHAMRIRERYILGYVVDGHGDLHSKNIFLLDEPVIFDCIEFNDHFRIVDVLDEIAFFCMDLEFYGKQQLASHFLKAYVTRYPCLLTHEDRLLFKYFRLYRAGVKLKINIIKATDPANVSEYAQRWRNVDGYYELFVKYSKQL